MFLGAQRQSDAKNLPTVNYTPTAEGQDIIENLGVQENESRDITFSANNMPFDLSVEGLSTNAISINSVGELEGILGPSIDVSSLMGGGLVTQLGITGYTFPDGFGDMTSSEGNIF